MKKIIFLFLMTLSATISITCSKDELESNEEVKAQSLSSAVVEHRASSNISTLIFYKTSLTSDNYLNSSAPRTHVIYNKSKIREIQLKQKQFTKKSENSVYLMLRSPRYVTSTHLFAPEQIATSLIRHSRLYLLKYAAAMVSGSV